eukprot:scaffold21101_cov16-Tisochrysis_lutea.AAC.1
MMIFSGDCGEMLLFCWPILHNSSICGACAVTQNSTPAYVLQITYKQIEWANPNMKGSTCRRSACEGEAVHAAALAALQV